jgi:hypothetical protein
MKATRALALPAIAATALLLGATAAQAAPAAAPLRPADQIVPSGVNLLDSLHALVMSPLRTVSGEVQAPPAR